MPRNRNEFFLQDDKVWSCTRFTMDKIRRPRPQEIWQALTLLGLKQVLIELHEIACETKRLRLCCESEWIYLYCIENQLLSIYHVIFACREISDSCLPTTNLPGKATPKAERACQQCRREICTGLSQIMP